MIKTLNTTGPYKVNQQVNYTIFVSNSGPSDATHVVVDDRPTNLTITGVSGAGCTGIPCTISSLPAGTQEAINVTAVINKTGQFNNSATATPRENDSNPSNNTDTSGGSANALADVSVVKSLRTPGPFSAGQSVTYRLVVKNDGPSVAKNIQVTDTPTNLTLTKIGGACSSLPCTIKSLEPGEQKIINVTAAITNTGRFDNQATAKSKIVEDPKPDNNTDADKNNGGSAQTSVDVSIVKELKTEGPYTAGQELIYSLVVANSGPSTATDFKITDTPSNMTITSVSGACSTLPCTIESLQAGQHIKIEVQATIKLSGDFDNTASITGLEGDSNPANNTDAEGNGGTAKAPELRITKKAVNLTAEPAGFVPYTIKIDNLSDVPVHDFEIIDHPALGLSLVKESLHIKDADNTGFVEGLQPLVFGGLDVPANGQAIITYIMRVGATALPGELVNVAVASRGGSPISNKDDASVILQVDPIMGQTRILGTVFLDHDRDGWQDQAEATDIYVHGGFAPGAYVANSTTVNYGDGTEHLADHSAPMLHGIDLGSLQGRRSLQSPVPKIVISQRLKSLNFTNSFVLTTSEGTELHMTAKGAINRDPHGEVKRGMNSQRLNVKRMVKALNNGQFQVKYIITNVGFYDWGLPGVKLATPRGLVIQTGAFGRYHIEAVKAKNWRRGRNYIVKVDRSSLPHNSIFTTENPLVRRVTTNAPIRFDFGVYVPLADLMIDKSLITKKPFTVGQQLKYRLKITNNGPSKATGVQVKDKGKHITITGVNGNGSKSFPYNLGNPLDVGENIKLIVNARLDTTGQFLNAALVKGNQNDPRPDNNIDRAIAFAKPIPIDTTTVQPEPVACDMATLPKSIHFTTDRYEINQAGAHMLDEIASYLNKHSKCSLHIIGHTDHDLNYKYNKALSMRRAQSVKAYLLAAGVSASQLHIKGVSFTEDAVAEKDILDKARNRRTSFRMIPDSGRIEWVNQIEDLQVDPEPKSWDYIFDFRHNAVPADIHFTDGKTGFNIVSDYLFYRIKRALNMYPKVTASFIVISSGNEALDDQKISSLTQTLDAEGLEEDDYEIRVINYDSGSPQTILINYSPAGVLIPVVQNDDKHLTDTPYPDLIEKARQMLNNREDHSILDNLSDALEAPDGVSLSEQTGPLSIEAKAGLSRLSSYMTTHPKVNVTLKGWSSIERKLQQAAQYLSDWGINRSRFKTEVNGNHNTDENYIEFAIQKISNK